MTLPIKLGLLVMLGLLGFAILSVAPNWRLTNSDHIEMVNALSMNRLADAALTQRPTGWFEPPAITVKQMLDGQDAIANAYKLVRQIPQVIAMALYLVIPATVLSLFSGDFLVAAMGLIGGAILMVIAPFYPFVVWLYLFLETGTSSYYWTWLALGIPILIADLALIILPLAILVGVSSG